MSSLKLLDSNDLSVLQPEQLLGGYVKLPWKPIYQETQIPHNKFILLDQSNNSVPAQVFRVDSKNSPYDFLLVSLNDNQAITSLHVEAGEPIVQRYGFPRLETILGPDGQARGVKLLNGQLSVWFNLVPSPKDYTHDWNWYAGSATSVMLGEQEMLEPFKWHDMGSISEPHWMGHDPQQRCMQVDKIQIWDQHSNTWSFPCNLCYQTYELITSSVGSMGASITIASAPFRYNNEGNKCRLYRIISLFKDVDYILEELFVRKEDDNGDNLEFKTHYFSFMDLSRPVSIIDKSHEVFLMVSNSCSARDADMLLFPIYGFRSNVFLEHLPNDPSKIVECPTYDFPDWPNKYRSFSWRLSPCRSAKCQHRFTFLKKEADLYLSPNLDNCDSVLPRISQDSVLLSVALN